MSAPIASGVNPLRGTASSSSKDVEGYEPKYTTEVVDGHGLSDRRLNRRNFASSIQRLPSSDTSVDISIDFSANADEFTKEEPTDEPVGPSFDLGPAPSPRPSPRPHPPAAPSHARFNTHLELRSTDHTLPLLPDLRSSSVPQVTFDLSVGQRLVFSFFPSLYLNLVGPCHFRASCLIYLHSIRLFLFSCLLCS